MIVCYCLHMRTLRAVWDRIGKDSRSWRLPAGACAHLAAPESLLAAL